MKAYPNHRSEGMDLRDYFAAQALPVLMHADSKPWEGHHEIHAEQAYKFADAMMIAREVQPSRTARQFTADETLKGRG
jgi:hypothetical protein